MLDGLQELVDQSLLRPLTVARPPTVVRKLVDGRENPECAVSVGNPWT